MRLVDSHSWCALFQYLCSSLGRLPPEQSSAQFSGTSLLRVLVYVSEIAGWRLQLSIAATACGCTPKKMLEKFLRQLLGPGVAVGGSTVAELESYTDESFFPELGGEAADIVSAVLYTGSCGGTRLRVVGLRGFDAHRCSEVVPGRAQFEVKSVLKIEDVHTGLPFLTSGWTAGPRTKLCCFCTGFVVVECWKWKFTDKFGANEEIFADESFFPGLAEGTAHTCVRCSPYRRCGGTRLSGQDEESADIYVVLIYILVKVKELVVKFVYE